MPLASTEQYWAMLDAAAADAYAFAAVNVSSSLALNAALSGFAQAAAGLEENLQIASGLLDECAQADVVLEIECGVVGGEEDGLRAQGPRERLYTTTADLLRVAEVLGTGERGRYLLAATFGNVHGVYQPGNVRLRPEVLAEGQQALAAIHPGARFKYPGSSVRSGSAPTRRSITRARTLSRRSWS